MLYDMRVSTFLEIKYAVRSSFERSCTYFYSCVNSPHCISVLFFMYLTAVLPLGVINK